MYNNKFQYQISRFVIMCPQLGSMVLCCKLMIPCVGLCILLKSISLAAPHKRSSPTNSSWLGNCEPNFFLALRFEQFEEQPYYFHNKLGEELIYQHRLDLLEIFFYVIGNLIIFNILFFQKVFCFCFELTRKEETALLDWKVNTFLWNSNIQKPIFHGRF